MYLTIKLKCILKIFFFNDAALQEKKWKKKSEKQNMEITFCLG